MRQIDRVLWEMFDYHNIRTKTTSFSPGAQIHAYNRAAISEIQQWWADDISVGCVWLVWASCPFINIKLQDGYYGFCVPSNVFRANTESPTWIRLEGWDKLVGAATLIVAYSKSVNTHRLAPYLKLPKKINPGRRYFPSGAGPLQALYSTSTVASETQDRGMPISMVDRFHAVRSNKSFIFSVISVSISDFQVPKCPEAVNTGNAIYKIVTSESVLLSQDAVETRVYSIAKTI